MMNIKGIFAVSLIAMVAVVAGVHTSNAVAAIASKGYVDEQVGLVEDKIPAAITVDSALSSTSTNPVQNKVINSALAGKEVTSNKVTSVRAAASATDTAYPSEKAVATALAGKANTSALSGYATTTALSAVEDKAEAAQSAASAAQTAADDAADAAAAAQSTASGKLSSISGSTSGTGNVVTSVSASGSTVSATKDITAEETKNKVKSVRAVASATDTAYPSEKAVATALAGKADATDLAHKVDIYQGDAKANQAVITNGSGNIITGFITKSMLGEDVVIPDEYELPPATTSALGGVKSGGDIDVDTSGAVTVKSARSATNAKNATNATNDAEGHDIILTYATKNELSDGLSEKQNSLGYTAENSANTVTSANYAANVSNDTKYPTVKAVADNIHNATLTIKKNGTSVGTFTANASVDKDINIEVPEATTASDILTATTVTSSGTGAVLTGVSVTAGKVTLQKGNVQIPSGGQNATSYVSIWVE